MKMINHDTDHKISTNNEKSEQNKKETKTNRYLLTDESFERLRKAQQKVQEETELTPSLRKLINRLVTAEAVDKATKSLITELS